MYQQRYPDREVNYCVADLAVTGGEILVSCRNRNTGDQLDTFPIVLERDEIDGFRRSGLAEIRFDAYDDDQAPPVPHFFCRPPATVTACRLVVLAKIKPS